VHEQVTVAEFTRQAATFDRAAVMSSAETLGALLELIPRGAGGRWLELACGTGTIARALAGRVDEVLGVDLTAAMLEVGRAEAAQSGLANVRFELGDATALALADGSFDGAVTRFSLHHIPVPGRLIGELARVVRPGGWVLIADHVGSEDRAAAAWHEEIERLRDPSHWACLTAARLRELGAAAGLTLAAERSIPFDLDYDEWLWRGTGGERAGELIARLLAERPGGCDSFRVLERAGERRLQLRYALTLWRV
jgi:SAM-dependent methyltransferase